MTDPAPDWADEEAARWIMQMAAAHPEEHFGRIPVSVIANIKRAAYERGKAERTLGIGELDALTITHMEGYHKGKADGERSGIIKGLREAAERASKCFGPANEALTVSEGQGYDLAMGRIEDAIRARITELEAQKP